MLYRSVFVLLAGLGAAWAGAAQAAVMYDQPVTNDVIFGSGNDNGSFTIDQSNGIELGLRAKLRFNESNLPENTFNSNGDGTYSFNAGSPTAGASWVAPTTPVWNFEWSINTDYLGTSGLPLDDLMYTLRIDFDPGPGTLFQTFDPINDYPPVPDHAIGDNTTGNGDGVTAGGDETVYEGLIAGNNLAQNSWNTEFFNDFSPFDTFDPNLPGIYTISLSAFSANEALLSSVSIDVLVTAVPEPATLTLMLLGLLALAGVTWRRQEAA